jgi:aryl sulfotransferase
MPVPLPKIEHIYQYHLDSTRWERFSPRDDDIVIATSFKSGTTWMQMIVAQLIFLDGEAHSLFEVSPWIDTVADSLDEVMNILEAQKHRRFIKTHLPLNGLPYHPQVKYIVVARDARDVCMSLWNHYRHFTPEWIDFMNSKPSPNNQVFPPCPDDIREFWRLWMTRGWFEWESEGYPFWTNLQHTQTWWNFRHLPNIFFVHFNDLLHDLAGEMRRISGYLGIDVAEDRWPLIVEAATFRSMKQRAEQLLPGLEGAVKGGAQTFFNKGTSGRWRGVLTESDLELYKAAVARELTPDCAHWLEHGRLGGL